MSEPKDATGTVLLVGETVKAKCCGCDGEVTFEIPESENSNPTFFHTLPYCKRFEETNTAEELVAYVRACRQGN